MYVYMLPSLLCGLIIPAEVEEAIRIGEMETVSLSKTCDKAIFKGLFICFFCEKQQLFLYISWKTDFGKNDVQIFVDIFENMSAVCLHFSER